MRYLPLLLLLLAGCTAALLHEAAFQGNLGPLRAAAPAAIDARDASGQTPLMHAARAGQVEALSLLLDRGAATDATDSAGYTALIHAGANGQKAAALLLLDRGANPAARDARRNYTALTWAELGLHRDTADALRARNLTY
jgi:uncharacterized protein